jgi:hypothetical protein
MLIFIGGAVAHFIHIFLGCGNYTVPGILDFLRHFFLFNKYYCSVNMNRA